MARVYHLRPVKNRYYVGLAASMHDPAVAILDEAGAPLFAEGAERYLQVKRAYHAPPDDLIRIPQLISEFCGPEAELIVAVSWSADMLRIANAAYRAWGVFPGVSEPDPNNEFSWPMPSPEFILTSLRNSLSQAGVNLKSGARIPNPVEVRRYDHHLAHAALGCYTAPFEECAVAVVDGYGEGRSTGFYTYRNGRLNSLPNQPLDSRSELEQNISLGHFYARLCALCGFDPILGEEWKVMGLAGYGSFDEQLYELMRPLIRVEGLSLRAPSPSDAAIARLRRLRKCARRRNAAALEAAGLAFTGQRVFEELMTDLLRTLHCEVQSPNLVLCGGCALNSSYNGRILERTPFTALHVPCAPADDGCALGAALLAFVEDHPDTLPPSAVASPYLGTKVLPAALERLGSFGGFSEVRRSPGALLEEVADLLTEGKIIGWMRGKAEFGPRALGHRSILADPRRPEMKDRLNSRVKFREEFRPFAPSILDEHGPEYFESYQPSRYMERTLRFRPEKVVEVPAVVHADGTGRVQSLREEWDESFHGLVRAFFKRTGVPVVLNTSLNVMGKPIAHSLEDALGIFYTTGLDALVVEDILLRKNRPPT
jgi:carbamoyltransferase